MPLLQQDFAGTLQAVAAIGYREVETIGTFGRDPAELRALFDKYNLRSPSQHMVPGNLYDVFNRLTRKELTFEQASRMWQDIMSVDRVEPIMEECIRSAQALGTEVHRVADSLARADADPALLEKFCTGLNEAGRLAARAGHVLNYHNHAEELKPHDGVIPYDFILGQHRPAAGQDGVGLLLDGGRRRRSRRLTSADIPAVSASAISRMGRPRERSLSWVRES